jgi:CRP/FNR family cyclic AMP-dependent transcriptional regulator
MFPVGHRIFADGGFATKFWLIRSGSVTLDVHVPGNGRVIIDSLSMSELVGCSWLFPPFRWACGEACLSAMEAFKFEAVAVRARCAAGAAVRYELMQRLIRVLQATRGGTFVLPGLAIHPYRTTVAGRGLFTGL